MYWEHLGLLHDSVYAERWDRKVEWYAAQGITPADAQHPPGGANGRLVWTRDDEHGGIDNRRISQLIGELFELSGSAVVRSLPRTMRGVPGAACCSRGNGRISKGDDGVHDLVEALG